MISQDNRIVQQLCRENIRWRKDHDDDRFVAEVNGVVMSICNQTFSRTEDGIRLTLSDNYQNCSIYQPPPLFSDTPLGKIKNYFSDVQNVKTVKEDLIQKELYNGLDILFSSAQSQCADPTPEKEEEIRNKIFMKLMGHNTG